jgi:hypothetical protein
MSHEDSVVPSRRHAVVRRAAQSSVFERLLLTRGNVMFQTTLIASAILTASMTVASAPDLHAQASTAAAKPATAADIAPFVGEWSLALQGPNGPGAFELSVRTEADKPRADITSEAIPKQSITDFTIAEKSLAMSYSFTWEGNPVSAVVSLTPAQDGMKAQIDFAGGAYIMTGTATKKDKPK